MLLLFIIAVVILNINDYRKYQQFLAQKNEADRQLGDMLNPLYENPNKTVENPLFQQQTE